MTWSLRVATAVVVLAIVTSAGWRVFVGPDYVITSPSMCPSICVGALVLDTPAGAHLAVGDVISFVPPGLDTVYTHRIVAILANGTFETKGDAANVVDPWRIDAAMVRGRTVLGAAGLGWFDLALPFLALALTFILIARRLLPTRHLREWDRLFVSLMVAIPIWLLRPLVRGVVTTTATLRPGVSQLVVVNTGLLPAQFEVPGGQVASFIAPGHRATLSGLAHRGGQLDLSQAASFHWWGWCLVDLLVLSPLLGYLVRLARPSSHAERDLVLWGRPVRDDGDPALARELLVASLATSASRRDRSRPFVAN